MSGFLSDADHAALDAIDGAAMLGQVLAWARINSGTRNLSGLATMAALLADEFSALPGQVALVEPTPVTAMDKDGTVAAVAHGRNLHLSVRPEAPARILLTGHMDTVFGIDHPFQAVSEIDAKGVINGPGVADMKGGIAVMLAALRALEASPHAANLGYDVVINSDEEVGSPGSAALIVAAAKGKRAALTYEPALTPQGDLASSRPGSGNFAIIVGGRSAHAGRNPEDGRNALVAAAEIAVRLDAAKRSGLSVNAARIEGGGPNNVVPDRAILHVNMRPATPADEATARAILDAVVAEVAAQREVDIHLHGGFGRPPKPVDAPTEKLFGLVKRCGAELGLDIGWRPSGGVCDGNNIAACGVPVLDTMGVRGGAIHSPDEYLIVESLAERARLSALVLIKMAQGEFE